MGEQFHFDPETYLELIKREVLAYDRLQDEVAGAMVGMQPRSALELGVGTGVTSQRVLAQCPHVHLVGIDESADMLDHARRLLPTADLRIARLEDPLPAGPFEIVFSALTVHHLDGPGKADLFRRVAAGLAPGGRFVLGDVVVPEEPADAVTPIDGDHDTPSSVVEQLAWLAAAGFEATVAWRDQDLAVVVASI
ncbi:MAG: class I SAM-dependent methyltransferase [Acidimicrobiia bacterium]